MLLWKLNLETESQLENSIETEIDFLWDVGTGIPHWYRVESECLAFNCTQTGLDPNDSKCGSPPPDGVRQMTYVAATSLSDLCFKLKQGTGAFGHKRPWGVKIRSIRKLSRPVRTTDFELVTGTSVGESPPGPTTNFNTSNGSGTIIPSEGVPLQHNQTSTSLLAPRVCQELEEEDFAEILECLEFTIDFDVLVHMGMGIHNNFVFDSVVGSGIIVLTGSAQASSPNQTSGSGIITLSGAAFVEFGNYITAGSGGIILSGSASIVSSVWDYEGSGGIVLSGQSLSIFPDYIYVGSGGITLSGGIEDYIQEGSGGVILSGEADYYLNYVEGEGGIVLSGASITEISDREYDGSGGIVLSGIAATSSPSYNYLGSGGIELEGGAAYSFPLVEGSGSVTLSGSAGTLFAIETTGEGGVVLSGVAEVISAAYSWVGSGIVVLSGTASNSFLGDLIVYAGMSPFLSGEIGVLFAETEGEDLTINTGFVDADCNCDPLPLVLGIRHNFNRANKLDSFLFRNGLILPKNDTLLYLSHGNIWRRTRHYSGSGEFTGTQEKWFLNFDFSCTNEVQNVEYGNNIWKFCFFARRTIVATGEDFDTRIYFTISPETICDRFPEKTLELVFEYDTQLELSLSSAQVDILAFTDEIGLFKSKSWESDPNLEITVTESDLPLPSTNLNLSTIFPTTPEIVR